MKTNHSKRKEKHIELPLPPEKSYLTEMDIYVRFMRHLRAVPNSKKEIKVLSAIQYTADMTNNSDARVAKVLVDLGLKAPRLSFPTEFLEHIDNFKLRGLNKYAALPESYKGLFRYWNTAGEDRFAHIKKDFAWRDTRILRESV